MKQEMWLIDNPTRRPHLGRLKVVLEWPFKSLHSPPDKIEPPAGQKWSHFAHGVQSQACILSKALTRILQENTTIYAAFIRG